LPLTGPPPSNRLGYRRGIHHPGPLIHPGGSGRQVVCHAPPRVTARVHQLPGSRLRRLGAHDGRRSFLPRSLTLKAPVATMNDRVALPERRSCDNWPARAALSDPTDPASDAAQARCGLASSAVISPRLDWHPRVRMVRRPPGSESARPRNQVHPAHPPTCRTFKLVVRNSEIDSVGRIESGSPQAMGRK